MKYITLGELAEHVGGKVVGDPKVEIKTVATLEEAAEGDISFLANVKYEKLVETTKASAVIVGKEMPSIKTPLLIAQDPYYAFMQIVVLLHGHRKHKKCGISPKAIIASSAKIGEGCHIRENAVIEDNVTVGKNCTIYPGVFIGEGTKLGDDCLIYPNAVIYENCIIGNRVTIQSNASVGEDGFGYSTHKGLHHKIPHIGRVIIEDDVEVGSSCGIERGTLGDTVIGKGTKMGDLVAIGHGTKVGAHCLLVAQVGIAGSATLGHHCVVGGQVGIVGHITVGNTVMIGAKAGVINDVPDGKVIVGTPAIELTKARRAYALIEVLPEMRKSIKDAEKRIDKLEGNKK
jgi:UDP-3-O-[3-hydroxymyristoyl] glucosamine N-acyltransferase